MTRSNGVGLTVRLIRVAIAVLLATVTACGASGHNDRSTDAGRTKSFAPPGLGASLIVPASWREAKDAFGAGFDFSLMAPTGDGAVMAMRTVAYGATVEDVASATRTFLRRIDAAISSQDSMSVEGHPTAVLRYSLPVPDQPSVGVTEYDVIVGDSTAIRIALAERNGSNAKLLAQIGASIKLGDLATSVDLEKLSVTDVGFVGEYRVTKDRPHTPRPAVLLLTGYGGGMPPQGIQLARAGYPTLSLAYYNVPTLPDVLANIPLEYFETALRWLRAQPDVDSDRVVVWGYSRGGEAALLLGATYPDLIHGVVANVPSNVVNGSFDVDDAVWTLHGTPLPYNKTFPKSDTVDAPDAEIKVEQIAGPVLLTCGGQDTEWASCPMARAVENRLDQHAFRFPHQLLDYPAQGHFLNVPPLSTRANVRTGGDPAWHSTLEFLNRVGLGE